MRFAFHITAERIYDTDHLGQSRPFDRIETARYRVGCSHYQNNPDPDFADNSVRYRLAMEKRHDRVETYTITMNPAARTEQFKQLPRTRRACRACLPVFLPSSSDTDVL